ncbi:MULTISPECIES: DUF2079 domain-containing protein [unclassified Sphingomonas]|uniref:DUF2079 domain-containing protein n=1 Tax=unclassified Sphingomonas TaxID=196159 RepID=UPI001F58E5D5|nr:MULTISPECIES: DUF2079 domain-containing protein [unclassified Sphingomonas]
MSLFAGLRKIHSNVIVLALLIVGALERAAWLILRPEARWASGEALNVAASVARDGTIGDVFARGSGLTAHFTPILPFVAGYIYRVFGLHSPTAEFLLATMSISMVLGSGYLLFLCLERLGTPKPWRLAALAIFCLIPLFPDLETTSFRIWEGALAALLGAWVLLRVLNAELAEDRTLRTWGITCAIASILFFLNPALGVAGFAMLGIWLIRQCPLRAWLPFVVSAVVILVAVLTPWTVRNYEAFGRFIPLRSNMGLELALANHPAAVSGDNQVDVFRNRLREIHPQESQAAFDRMQAMGGERVYADRLGDEAKQWIRAHPAQFATLSLRHVVQFYFPPAWQWDIYGGLNRAIVVKLALVWTLAALGLIAALASLVLWRGRYLYPAMLVLVTALPYAMVQPVLRYHYLIHGITLFLGIELIRRCVAAVMPGRQRAG